jgi:hydrogenase expression/formation protein HypE
LGKLKLGKIPIHLLDSTVLRLTGATSDRVVTPATAGVDFAAVKLPGGFMIVSADPITGASEEIGELAVKVSANDVATSGTAPEFAESVVLLPEGTTTSDLEKIATQIHDAAVDIGVTILGGHTEVTPGLERPIVVVTVFGFADDFVTSAGARDGDLILMTKTAAIEGTSELAREFHFPAGTVAHSTLKSARRFIDRVDATKEAVAAYQTGRVHAMHDCTEGGVVGAVYEMSHASGIGFVLDETAVPVAHETAEICDWLSIDPLLLIGSGSLLIAVEKSGEARVKKALKPICRVTRIGEFRKGPRIIVRKDGSKKMLKEAPQDELWRAFGRTPRSRNRA